MTITIAGGKQIRTGGVFQSAASQSAVTTTATQTLAFDTDVRTLDGPTDTISNFYTLADGDEGQEVWLIYNTTGTGGGSTASSGDIHVTPANMAVMDSITFRQVDQYCRLKFMNSNWHVLERTTWEEAVLEMSTATDGATASGGAIPLTVDSFQTTRSTGTDILFTLADGLYEGQMFHLHGLAATTPNTVTPNAMTGLTSISLDRTTTQAGSAPYAQLRWWQAGWHLTSPLVLTATSISNISDSIANA